MDKANAFPFDCPVGNQLITGFLGDSDNTLRTPRTLTQQILPVEPRVKRRLIRHLEKRQIMNSEHQRSMPAYWRCKGRYV